MVGASRFASGMRDHRQSRDDPNRELARPGIRSDVSLQAAGRGIVALRAISSDGRTLFFLGDRNLVAVPIPDTLTPVP